MLAALLIAVIVGQVPPLLKRPEPIPKVEFGPWRKGGVPEQAEAPCPKHLFVYTVDGKCWGKTTDKVPCPPETWQHKDTCYVPLLQPEQPRS